MRAWLQALNFDQRNTLLAYLCALTMTTVIAIGAASFWVGVPILFFARLFTNTLFALRNRSQLFTDNTLHFKNDRIVFLTDYDTYARLIKVLTPLLLLGFIGITFAFCESRFFGLIAFLLTFSYTTFLNGYLIVKNLPLVTWTFEIGNSTASSSSNPIISDIKFMENDDLSTRMRHSPAFSHLPSNIHNHFHHPR